MKDKSTGVLMEPLETVAQEIVEHSGRAQRCYQHKVKAALKVKEARLRVEAGEAGDVTWAQWAKQNIKLSGTYLRELNRIAEADDPEKLAAYLDRLNRDRVAKYRKRKAAERSALEGVRRDLIDWAKKARIDEVRLVRELIEGSSDLEELLNSLFGETRNA